MKNIIPVHKLFFSVCCVLAVVCSHAQKQFTITSSRANNYCNSTCTLLDNPDLNGNPTAIVFVTPVEVNGINLNPHPICAYYNGKQWSVFNIDNSTIVPGAQFNVEYYSKPDDTHFVHVVAKENLVKNNSYIDHAGLNGNPRAQFQLFQNASPNVRGGGVNKDEIKTAYDEAAGKWFIAKTNANTLDLATGYNISISSEMDSKSSPITSLPGKTPAPVSSTGSFTPFTKANNFGQRVFVTVLGQTQGQFAGELGTARMEVFDFEMETNTPRDMATGQASGRRQHLPVMFQKSTGAASIQFYKAIATNERLTSVVFEVYEPSANGSGATVLSYKVVLTNGSVSGFKQSFTDGGKGFMDSIKLIFQSKELVFINGGLTATDSWVPVN